VGGCERSGTTLLASRVADQPGIVAVPESQFLVELLRDPPGEGGPDPSAAFRAAVPERVLDHWRFLLWELDLDDAERAEVSATANVAELGTLLARLYARRAPGVDAGSLRAWIDHTPWNLRHAGLLARAFPDAVFVHIVRDGRAVAASVKPLSWGPNDALAAAHWWLENVALGLVAEADLGPERVLRVHYEDLVRDPETVAARIRAFAGLVPPAPGEPGAPRTGSATADSSRFVAPTYTRSQHRLVELAPDPARIDAWRADLSAREVERFESVAETMLAHLGYECDHGGRARGPSVLEQTGRAVAELARFYVVNPPRNRARRVAVRARAHGLHVPARTPPPSPDQ
jgi:hypothetical protein